MKPGAILCLAAAAVAIHAAPPVRYLTLERHRAGQWRATAHVVQLARASPLTKAVNRALLAGAKSRMAAFVKSFGGAGWPGRGLATFAESQSLSLAMPGVVSVAEVDDVDMGGAHPNEVSSYDNWAMVSGKPRRLRLQDLLRSDAGAMGAVSNIVIEKLKDNPGAAWVRNGEVTKLNQRTSNTFLIERNGLVFVFDPYVMGPYSSGTITVRTSWKDLSGLVDPKGPLKALLGTRS